MSRIVRIKLTPESSYITPLFASTIWGHIAWNIFLKDGEEKGKAFVEAFHSDPPFVLSDGFPEEYLPKPFVKWDEGINQKAKVDVIEEMKWQKKYKKILFLKAKDIHKLFSFSSEDEESFEEWREEICKRNIRKWEVKSVVLKNVIDRKNNMTLDGGIFDQKEVFCGALYFSLYCKIFDQDFWQGFDVVSHLRDIFEGVGFGAKKSTGKGIFSVEVEEDFSFGIVPCANKSILLSESILAGEETKLLTTARYKTKTHYGKLGESFSHDKNPFKKPLIRLVSGSVLDTEAEYCGSLVQTSSKNSVYEYSYGFLLSV